MNDAGTLFQLVERWWPRPRGLVASIMVVVGLVLMLGAAFEAGRITLAIFLGVALASLVAVWLIARRPPRPRAGKIGFAVALHCEDEDEETQRYVRNDFVAHLRQLIESGPSKSQFQFIAVPAHLAERVQTDEGLAWLRSKLRCHFVLHGQVRSRRIGESNRFFIDLGGMVRHLPLPGKVREMFAKEFTELIPGRVNIENNVGLLGFEFTSRWTHIVAKYVIGLAMAFSGSFQEADAMLAEVEALVARVRDELPAYAKIRARTPQFRAAMQVGLARQRFEHWRDIDRDTKHLDAMAIHLDRAQVLEDRNVVLGYRAILEFLLHRNCVSARQLLNRIPPPARDAIWHYNQGFLYAYDGNLKKADHHYRMAVQLPIPADKIGELELFMEWVVTVEPDRYHVHYALALFNHYLKSDNRSAVREYRAFLANVPKEKYRNEQRRIERYLAQLTARPDEESGTSSPVSARAT